MVIYIVIINNRSYFIFVLNILLFKLINNYIVICYIIKHNKFSTPSDM